MHRARVFSGIQPTGVPHLGNYLGALRNWVAQQDEHDTFYCIVDLHALTMPWEPAALERNTIEMAATLIACGIDVERSVLFRQSHVAQHTELGWILTCVSRMGELRRMIQFKERSRGEVEGVGVGLFTYPVLQAADVLLYQAHGVPVGEDQRQHIELMRDLAQRFNATFGEVFTLPQAFIPEHGARIMALDDPTQKMSKSSGRPASWILITDEPDAIAHKVRTAVTDSGRDVVARGDKPAVTNLLTILSVVEGVDIPTLEERFRDSGYAALKTTLTDALVAHLGPLQQRYRDAVSDPGSVEKSLLRGAERAGTIAEATMADVWRATGLGARPAG